MTNLTNGVLESGRLWGECPRVAPVAAPTLKQRVALVWNRFERIIWEYCNQSAKIFKQTLKITIIAVSFTASQSARLSRVIASVGFLSAINILLTLKNLPDQLKDWWKMAEIGDTEGSLFTSLSLVATIAGILDDTTVLVNTMSIFNIIPQVAFFGTIGLPLAIGLLSYSVVNKGYQIFRHGQFAYQLPKEFKSMKEVKEFLAERLGDGLREDLKDRKISILTRRSDPRVVNIMKNLQEYASTKNADMETVNQAMQDINTLMKRKITVGCVGMAANTAAVTTLVASMVFPAMSPLVIPAVMLAKSGLTIVTHTYMTLGFQKGLNLPEFLKKPVDPLVA